MQTPAGYEIARTLWQHLGLTGYEAIEPGSGTRVLLTAWGRARGDGARESDPNWRACHIENLVATTPGQRPPVWQHENGRSQAIFEWFDGSPLEAARHGGLADLPTMLEAASATARCLDGLHAAGCVHGHLQPASVLWSTTSRRVRLSDLGFLSLPGLPNLLRPGAHQRATLPYQSPEATGRLGTAVDERSDLYSLGAMLYEWLVGTPPFPLETALEIQHAHLARQPPAPGELAPGIPEALSQIVLKLLAKLPEQRYRSGRGLAADLDRCLAAIRSGDFPGRFDLGSQDIPLRLRLSSKLYGRSSHEAALLAAFDARRAGGRAVVLVGGEAGIGKTALVDALRSHVVREDGFFTVGKFEQRTEQQPFVGLASALRHLCQQILSLPEADLRDWQARITTALGQRMALLAELVPEITLLAPAPLAPFEVASVEARWWFVDACRRLMRLFVGPSSPLVLFLDDVQWMDRASGEVLCELLQDRKLARLLVVAAYRDDEVVPDSALAMFLTAPPPVDVTRIRLAPLDTVDIAHLLCDSFVLCTPAPDLIASALAVKTGGNPLYLRRYIESLGSDDALRFDDGVWTWDLAAVDASDVTANRATILAAGLRSYAEDTREVLNVLACLGESVALALLARACNTPPEQCARALIPALSDGLVIRDPGARDRPDERYRFTHDKIAQAAYELYDEQTRSRRHASLARLLHSNNDHAAGSAFMLVEQIDRSGRHASEGFATGELTSIYLESAQRARDNTAFEAASHYLTRAAAFLEESDWDHRYAQQMRWHQLSAEIEYQLGNPGVSRSLIYSALEHARGVDEVATLYAMLIVQNTRVGLDQEAIDQGIKALAHLGFALPERPFNTALERELAPLRGLDIETRYAELLSLPPATDARVIKAMDILMELLPPTFFKEPVLNRIIAARMTSMSLTHGIAPGSPKGIVNYGAALAEHGEYRMGYLFGRLAVDLADRHGLGHIKLRVLYTLAGGLNHWVNHLRTTPPIVNEGFRLSVEHGERDYGGYLLTLGRCQNEFFLGANISTFLPQVEDILEHVEETGNALCTGLATAAFLCLKHLANETDGDRCFDAGAYSEQTLLQSSATPKRRLVDCFFHLMKAHNLLFLEQFDAARDAIAISQRHSTHMAAPMGLAMLNLFSCLLEIEEHMAGSRPPEAVIATLKARLAQMESWAHDCPDNFRHCVHLIQGGLHRLQNDEAAALRSYGEAAEWANRSEYPQFEALAHQCLARLWQTRHHEYYTRHHLRAALRCVDRWGAERVSNHVRARLCDDDARDAESASRPVATTSGASSDLVALIDLMRKLGGDIDDFDALKHELALTVAQVAGAQRAVLFLMNNGSPVPVLGVDIEGGGFVAGPDEYPNRLINLVSRTKEQAVIGDGARSAGLEHDAYLAAHAPRSALALPLKHGGAVEGILYIENRINRMDLSESRTALLDVLASQAALSIRNAALYEGLDREVRARTRELRELNDELEDRVNAQAAQLTLDRQFKRFLPPTVARKVAEGGLDALKRHRGEVAIVFCDLRGFSAYSGSVDPEEEGRMLDEYRNTVDALFARYGATVDHWAGDGAMAFLGDPFPPDPPSGSIQTAVDLAIELRAAVSRLIAGWRAHGHRLGFGVAVTYGWATMGLTGRDWRMDYSAMGRYVNLCSRLCDAAEDGQILVTQRVVAELSSEHTVRFVASLQLKGVPEPVEVYDVASVAPLSLQSMQPSDARNA